MLDIAPELRIVDVTHDVPAFDVRAGALALVRAVQYLPEGVVLAVVDPGVGTDRRCVAVDVGNAVLVGPDNGLLAPAVAMLGGPQRVVEITSAEHRLAAPGPTFAGRDVMAPAAAYLAAGLPIDALGPEVDPVLLTPALVPLPNEDGDGRITGEVLWVDRYGNCQLNIAPEQLELAGAHLGDAVEVTVTDAAGVRSARRARWVHTFADAKPSELVVLVDSYGMCTARARPPFGGRPSSGCAPRASSPWRPRRAGVRAPMRPASRSASDGGSRAREARNQPDPRGAPGADPARVDPAVRVPHVGDGVDRHGNEKRRPRGGASSGGKSSGSRPQCGRFGAGWEATLRGRSGDPRRPHAHTRDRNPRSCARAVLRSPKLVPQSRRPAGPLSL